MQTIIDQLKCGECGSETFKLDHVMEVDEPSDWCRVGGHGSGGFDGSIRVTCVACGQTTCITTPPAKLTTDHGSLCGGWGR